MLMVGNAWARDVAQLAASPEAFVVLRSRFARGLATMNTVMYLLGTPSPAHTHRARRRGLTSSSPRPALWTARRTGIGDRHLDNFLFQEKTYGLGTPLSTPSIAWHGVARRGTAPSIAWHGAERRGTEWDGAERRRMARNGAEWRGMARNGVGPRCTAH